MESLDFYIEEKKPKKRRLQENPEIQDEISEQANRLKKSLSQEGNIAIHKEAKLRHLEAEREDYDKDTHIFEKGFDLLKKKFWNKGKLVEMEEEKNKAIQDKEHFEKRQEQLQRARQNLIGSLIENIETKLDPYTAKTLELNIGGKINILLKRLQEQPPPDHDERIEIETALSKFKGSYERIIRELEGVSEEEKNLITDFVLNTDKNFGFSTQAILGEERRKDYNGELNLNNLVLVHKTDYLPHGSVKSTAGIDIKVDLKKKDGDFRDNTTGETLYNSPRGTISFSINFPVGSHYENDWSNKDYAILIPYKNVQDRIINNKEEDAYVFGELPLQNANSELIISYKKAEYLTPARLEKIKEKCGASIVVVGKKGETIDDTTKRRITEKGFSYINGHNDGWYSASPKDHAQMEKLARENRKDYALHAGTAFSKFEKYIQGNMLAVAYGNYENIFKWNNGYVEKAKNEYFAEANKYLGEIRMEIEKTGRPLNEYEEEALKKLEKSVKINFARLLEYRENEVKKPS
ncbi:MAG: hypothetical protein WAV11_01570 [Minisyncoccia bacterium]